MRHDAEPDPLRAVAVVALSASAVVMLTFLFQASTSWGFYSLFAVPVAIAGRQLGARVGIAVAIAAGGMIVVHASVAGTEIGLGGFATRAAALMAVAVVAAPHGARAAHFLREQGVQQGARLTPRETDVLRMLALGHTNQETADQLYLSVRTVESHRARLQRKLGRRGRAELTAYARSAGLIEPVSQQNGGVPNERAHPDPPSFSPAHGQARGSSAIDGGLVGLGRISAAFRDGTRGL